MLKVKLKKTPFISMKRQYLIHFRDRFDDDEKKLVQTESGKW